MQLLPNSERNVDSKEILGSKPLPQGGRRVKSCGFQKKWTHADAVQSKEDLIRNAVLRKNKSSLFNF